MAEKSANQKAVDDAVAHAETKGKVTGRTPGPDEQPQVTVGTVTTASGSTQAEEGHTGNPDIEEAEAAEAEMNAGPTAIEKHLEAHPPTSERRDLAAALDEPAQVSELRGMAQAYSTPDSVRENIEQQLRDAKGELKAQGKPDKDARQGMLLRTVDGAPVRLMLAGGTYRDLENGKAFIAGDDPDYDEIEQWAKKRPTVEIVGVKAGATVCPVCGDHVDGGDPGMTIHTYEYHVDSGESEETGRPPSAAQRERAAQRRRERVERAARTE